MTSKQDAHQFNIKTNLSTNRLHDKQLLTIFNSCLILLTSFH